MNHFPDAGKMIRKALWSLALLAVAPFTVCWVALKAARVAADHFAGALADVWRC